MRGGFSTATDNPPSPTAGSSFPMPSSSGRGDARRLELFPLVRPHEPSRAPAHSPLAKEHLQAVSPVASLANRKASFQGLSWWAHLGTDTPANTALTAGEVRTEVRTRRASGSQARRGEGTGVGVSAPMYAVFYGGRTFRTPDAVERPTPWMAGRRTSGSHRAIARRVRRPRSTVTTVLARARRAALADALA
jgi:hypothetical protein